MKKLTPEEKQALKEKIHEAGMDDAGKPLNLTLSDDNKKKMKEMIDKAGHDRLSQLDKMLHSKKSKKHV